MAVANKEVFTSDETLWVQQGGPGTDFVLMGNCYEIGDTTEPEGDRTPHFCRDLTAGAGNFSIIKQTRGTPGLITFQLSAPKYRMDNLLRTLTCPFDLQVIAKSCGDQTAYGGWDQIDHYRNCEITGRSKSRSATREEEVRILITADVSSTNFEDLRDVTLARTNSTGTAEAANAVAICDPTPSCADDCGAFSAGCQRIVTVFDLTILGPAVPHVVVSDDGGNTITIRDSTYTNAQNISDVVCDADRIIISLGTDQGAAPPNVAYSDDDGVTWTIVAMPLPAINGFIHDLFKLDTRHLWACGNTGYIYFSDDWGLTWVTQDAGAAAGGLALNAIMMVNEFVGYAVGAGDNVVKTIDGGQAWFQVTDTGAAAVNNTVYAITEDIVYVGTSNGELRRSTDGGTTWAQVAFPVDGVGTVQWIEFYDEEFGFMLHDDAGSDGRVLRTIDGGENWVAENAVANDGFNRLAVCNPNQAFIAGELDVASGEAFMGVVTG